jgi:hypothetical protein
MVNQGIRGKQPPPVGCIVTKGGTDAADVPNQRVKMNRANP